MPCDRRGHAVPWWPLGGLIFLCGCNWLFGIRAPIEPASDGGGDEPVTSAGCRESAGSFTDPNTGVTWTVLWYCGNDYGAPVFEKASGANLIATMATIESWFVCYRHGEAHKGGNDVWYYTQGDQVEPGWEARKAWGYMPAYATHTSVDPVPGMVECTSNP